MSKLLVGLLALDIGVSLSKVFIFTWKCNYFAKKEQLFSKKILGIYFIWDLFYKIIN